MRLTRADRHRLVFASVLTAVAFPAVWWENDRDSSTNRPSVAAVGLAAEEPAGAAVLDTGVPPIPEPAYLAPVAAPNATASDATVLVGSADDELVGTTDATFDRDVGRASHCWYDGVGEGESITVINRANGQFVECMVVGRDEDSPSTVVLAPSAFIELADFTDAPIHVELRQ